MPNTFFTQPKPRKTKTIAIRVTPVVFDSLKKLAEVNNVSVSEIFTLALNNFSEKKFPGLLSQKE